MSFFKKNKPKSIKSSTKNKKDKSELEKEIENMDRERHLDNQLEELNAQLNMPSTENDQIGEHSTEKSEESDFIAESLGKFKTPRFMADIPSKTASIDVTSSYQSETSRDIDSSIENLLSDSKKSIGTDRESDISLSDSTSSETSGKVILPTLNSDSSVSGPSRFDIGAMRLDVAKISADIQSGEEIYRRALQRVEGLMGFVEKAEVDFSVLNRLEPENRRLKARLRTSQGEVETIKGKLILTAAELDDFQKQLTDKTKQYESARSQLATAASSLQEYDRALKTTKSEAEKQALAVERHKTALNVEGRENQVLRQKIGELTKILEQRQSDFLEASKMVESLRTDCDDFRQQADTYRSESQELRLTLNAARRQNNSMKSEMKALHDDITTFKTQYEFNAISREDRVTELEAQIAFLTKEVDAKTDVANTATNDLAALRNIRNEQDIERDRLEKQVVAAHEKIKDTKKLWEAKNAEAISVLQTEINTLKTEMVRREEASSHVSKEAADLQREYNALEEEHDRLKSRMAIQTEQLEKTIQNDPAKELRLKIEELTEQLRIKDSIVKSAAQDVSSLQKEHEAQTLENKRLEELIHNQTFQLEAAQKALFESKQSETELDQKYKDIAAALSVSQARRKTESPSQNPDIAPDRSTNSAKDDAEDKIMDYKFGSRKDIG